MQRRPWLVLVTVPLIGLVVAALLFVVVLPSLVSVAFRAGLATLESRFGFRAEVGRFDANPGLLLGSSVLRLDVRDVKVSGPAEPAAAAGSATPRFDMSLGRFFLEIPLRRLLDSELRVGSVELEDLTVNMPACLSQSCAEEPQVESPVSGQVVSFPARLSALDEQLAAAFDLFPFVVVVERVALRRLSVTAFEGPSTEPLRFHRLRMESGVVFGLSLDPKRHSVSFRMDSEDGLGLEVTSRLDGASLGAESVTAERSFAMRLPSLGLGASVHRALQPGPIDQARQGAGATDAPWPGHGLVLQLDPLELEVSGLRLRGVPAALPPAWAEVLPFSFRLSVAKDPSAPQPDASPASSGDTPSSPVGEPGGSRGGCRSVVGLSGPGASGSVLPETATKLTMAPCHVALMVRHGEGLEKLQLALHAGVAESWSLGWDSKDRVLGPVLPLASARLHVTRNESTLLRVDLAPRGGLAHDGPRLAASAHAFVRPEALLRTVAVLPPEWTATLPAQALHWPLVSLARPPHPNNNGQVLRAGIEVEVGNDWIAHASLRGARRTLAAARPHLAVWLDLTVPHQELQSEPPRQDPTSVAEDLFNVPEPEAVAPTKGARRGPGAQALARAAFLGTLEDSELRMKGRIQVRDLAVNAASAAKASPKARPQATPAQMSIGEFAAQMQLVWKLWSRGERAQVNDAVAGGANVAGRLPAHVPTLLRTWAARTPLASWAERPVRSVELSAVTKVRALRWQSGPIGGSLDRLDAFDARVEGALAEDGSLSSRTLSARLVVSPLVEGTPGARKERARQTPVSLSFDANLGFAPDLTSGSLEGRAVVFSADNQLVSLPLGLGGQASAQGTEASSTPVAALQASAAVAPSHASAQRVVFGGRFELPFRAMLKQSHGSLESLVFDARPLFRQVTLAHEKASGRIALEGVSGEVPFQQQVSLSLTSDPNALVPVAVTWDPLLDENPFRRGGSVLGGPYSPARNFVVNRVVYADWEGGPLAASLAVNQNQVLFDRMDAEFMSGSLAGQCFVNVAPGRLLLDFNGRASGVDGGRLLGITGLARRDSELSGRVALSYAVDSSLVSGRVDVTKIPKRLLEQVLIRLDPSGSDSAVGAARLALSVAAPESLAVEMGDGLAHLDIGVVTAAGGSSHLRIPSLPLTRVLEDRTAPLRRSLGGARADDGESP